MVLARRALLPLVPVVLIGCRFSPEGTAPRDDAAEVDAAIDGGPFPDGGPDGDRGERRRRLRFDNAAGGPLLEFPILVRLDPSRIDYARVAADALDLRFIDANGTDVLPHEIERWTPGGVSIIWVSVPLIDAASTTDFIYLSYGSGTPSTQNPHGVWANGYAAVWHLGQEGSGAFLLNSAGSAYHGTPTGTASVPGQLAGARAFHDTGDERVTFANGGDLFNAWAQLTVEAWVFPDYSGDAQWVTSGNDQFLDKGGPIGLGRVWRDASQPANRGTLQIDANFTGGSVYAPTEIERIAWNWIVYTLSGTSYRVYRNGAMVGNTVAVTTALQGGTNSFYLGKDGGALNGILDEVRIATVGRDESWIDAQYRSMMDTFVSYGPEELP